MFDVKEVPISAIRKYMAGGEHDGQRYDEKKFEQVILLLDQHFDERLKRSKDGEEKERILLQQHRATTGHPQEVQEMKTIIQQILEEYRMNHIQFPPMYPNLVDALFHEAWGLGVVSVWHEQYHDIAKCRVNGQEVWYRKPGEQRRVHERYRDLQSVKRLVDNLLRNNEQHTIKAGKEYAELSLFDGTRVTISLPPRVRHISIAFRRGNERYIPLQEQAERYGTIEEAAIPIYRMIPRCGCKTMLTGEPGTGKTSFLKTLFAETKPALVTITCESVFELDLKRQFPERDITEYEGNREKLVKEIVPLALRQDVAQFLLGEVREHEAGAYKEICSNTQGFVGSSMHESDSTNVPGTLARKEIRQSSGMQYLTSLMEFAQKMDFVLVMEFGEDDTIIRNAEATVIDFDSITLSVKGHRVIWYDGAQWYFADALPARLARRMRRYDPEAFDSGMAALRQLAQQRPIPDDERVIDLTYRG
ncbi:ATPase, T2SS/T4P/T4SS family [Paenibacillus sp. y28]|uniref:ATPase, T2SS/T4P/T4SS family n=1 Tax=Paenibacillus sp. y28 TaxID=3129110 RepID=UPI003015CA76